MLVSFKSEIPLKGFERILVISVISEAHENAPVLLMRLELEDAKAVCLYGLETLMQALQEVVLA